MFHGKATTDIILGVLFLVLGVIWALVIFGFSSQDAEKSASLSGEVTEVIVENFQVQKEPDEVEHIVRKLAHLGEYMVFGAFMFASAAFFLKAWGKSPYIALALDVSVCFAYAESDEYHQGFVSGRSPQFTDVLIDTAGGLAAGLIITLVLLIVKRRRISVNS